MVVGHLISLKRLVGTALGRDRRVSSVPGKEADREAILSRLRELTDSMESISTHAYLATTVPTDAEVGDTIPNFAEIEINDSCNLNCAMCQTSLSKRKKGLMDLGLFEETIAKMATLGAKTTSLHTIGDPLANKNLGRYLEILRRYDIKVGSLTTNGLLFERQIDTVFEFRDVINRIRPSIDAVSKDVFERIRIGGKWEDLLRNLTLFADRNGRAENPFPVKVACIVSADNFHEVAFLPSTFSFLTGHKNFVFSFVNSLSPDGSYFQKNRIFDNWSTQNIPCSLPFTSLYVLKEGDISLCCRDYHGEVTFGNVKDWEIGKLPWDGSGGREKLEDIRKAHLQNNSEKLPGLCRNCFVVDPRVSTALTLIVWFFYSHSEKHPVYLQNFLFEWRDHLQARRLSEIADGVARL